MNAKSAPRRRRPASLRALLPLLLVLAACAGNREAGPVRVWRLLASPVAPLFSAVPSPGSATAGSGIDLVVADPLSRTISTVAVTLPAGGEPVLRPAVLDRIAEAADASPDFGSHAYARFGGTEYLGYLDRSADGRLALKQLWREAGEESWSVELVSPAGRPLCLLSRGESVALVLADPSGLLVSRVGRASGAPAERLLECAPPAGPASVVRSDSGDAFAAIDGENASILIGRFEEGGVRVLACPPPHGVSLGGPSDARMGRGGRIDLFLYDAVTRELLDLRGLPDCPELVRVTRAYEVSAVAAFTREDETLYLYAEATRDPSGGTGYALSLLWTGRGRGGVLRRRMHESPVPYRAMRAHLADGELRVVALADGLELIELPLDEGAARR